jgi:hypothetical protein
MRKIMICGMALATAAVPTVADAKKDVDKPTYCTPKSVGYNAKGTYESGTLTQTKGADTEKRGDDRYSGTIVVNVTKANHKGLKGTQDVTLTDARVKFHPRNDSELAAGDRVKLSGKVTRLPKKCNTPGFEPKFTAKKADFKAKKA